MAETKPTPVPESHDTPDIKPWVQAAEHEAAAYQDMAALNPDDELAKAAAQGKAEEAQRRHIVADQ